MPLSPRFEGPESVANRILAGEHAALSGELMATYLSPETDVWELINAADRVRRHRFGHKIHLCSIVNAKEGGCPEDCAFCSQSKHHQTHVAPRKFTEVSEILEASRKASERQASALGIVTATRGLEDGSRALDHVTEAIAAVRNAGHTEAHASIGFISEQGLDRLIAAGLTELNHNLETGRSYFGKIVTTHTYDERIETIRLAKRKGLRTCVGGIFGMGEAISHRVELAMELRALEVDEVPLNFLVSIDGTKLDYVEPLAPLDILRIIAAFRLALPRPNIFIAAGRHHLGQLAPFVFTAGASGIMIGDFLTTSNRTVEDDLQMIRDLGLEAESCGAGSNRGEFRTPAPVIASPKAPPRRLPIVASSGPAASS